MVKEVNISDTIVNARVVALSIMCRKLAVALCFDETDKAHVILYLHLEKAPEYYIGKILNDMHISLSEG